MKLPRDLSGDYLAGKLSQPFGYKQTRQTGSHLRLTRTAAQGTHHITIPRHKGLRVGTLNSILSEIASHLEISKAELLDQLK